jgi:2-polyprenyl-6-methoxyphenol hydroxylase-like FAD-dependent oxidoreductase
MRTVVVGAGPIGSFTALMLARRGHDVLVVDRDPGPPATGPWERRGVMQFNLPHMFRAMVRQSLLAEVPELWTAALLAGGIPALPPGAPEELTGLRCRRAVLEPVIWSFTTAESGICRLTGHADGLVTDGGRVAGIVVDGTRVDADLVVVATGRSSRLGDDLRAPGDAVNCGFAYCTRQYRARPGFDAPDWGIPTRLVYNGYETIVMPQDDNTFSALIIRPTEDRRLLDLRHNRVFEAAAAAIPLLAEWTDPERFEPITDVQSGNNLVNAFRGQRSIDGTTTPGVLFVGDAVLTTNPAAGRGVALGMQQARHLLALLDATTDTAEVASEFDDWCVETMRPWYEDHVYWDRTELQRFAGQDLDLDARIPSDVIVECAQVDPSLMAFVGPYLGMLAGPQILDGAQEPARAVLRSGWRPSCAPGPSRDELAELTLTVAV